MISAGEPNISKKDIDAVLKTLRRKELYWRSPVVGEFEKAFAKFCGVRYAAAVNSGSSALLLAVLSLRLPRGSEVIVPAFGYIAAVNVVVHAGLKPVFVDVELDTGNIDPREIAKKITRRTKAIMCIHTYGHPCDMDPIKAIARKHDLYVVEDAAEAHGAEYKGKRTGSLGDVACFSFTGNKLITAGEGGMIVSDSKRLYDEFSWSRQQYHFVHGHDRYWHAKNGYGMYMSAMQAALGLSQLRRANEFVRIKRSNAKYYSRELGKINDLHGAGLKFLAEKDYAKSTFWMYGIVTRSRRERDDLIKFLRQRDVETRNFFPAIHWQPPFRYVRGKFPASERLASCGLYLPSGTGLRKEELRKVMNRFNEFYKRRA